MLNGNTLDALRIRLRPVPAARVAPGMRLVDTPHGRVRVLDSRSTKESSAPAPTIVMVPDGPCVIEHHATLVRELSRVARVVTFDLPGFGFSQPDPRYRHTLAEGSDVVLAVLDACDIRRATLAFTCANGYYAMASAHRFPERIAGLVLAQTPSVEAMHRWADRNVPKLLRMPLVGQAIMAAAGRAWARTWLRIALPKGTDPRSMVAVSDAAFADGAAFGLAGIVQGFAPVVPSDLPPVAVPTLAVYGDRDRSHRGTDFASVRVHLPDAEVEVFPGCGHFPHLEQVPAFVDAVRKKTLAWHA